MVVDLRQHILVKRRVESLPYTENHHPDCGFLARCYLSHATHPSKGSVQGVIRRRVYGNKVLLGLAQTHFQKCLLRRSNTAQRNPATRPNCGVSLPETAHWRCCWLKETVPLG